MTLTRSLLALGLLGLMSAPAWAAESCSTTVEANDAMQFNTKAITVPKACTTFSVTLKHTGKLPVTAMGHNWVLARSADEAGVVADGMKAGAAHNYEKPGDTRILAHTRLIGGGQSDSATVKVAQLKAGESYAFFCTFPGHASLMKGTLTRSP